MFRCGFADCERAFSLKESRPYCDAFSIQLSTVNYPGLRVAKRQLITSEPNLIASKRNLIASKRNLIASKSNLIASKVPTSTRLEFFSAQCYIFLVIKLITNDNILTDFMAKYYHLLSLKYVVFL